MAIYKSPLDMSKQLKDPYYGLDLDNFQKDELVSKFKGKDLETALERLRGGEGYGDVINGLVRYENYDDESQYPNSKYLVKETSIQNPDPSNFSYWDDERIKGAFNFGNGSWKDMLRYMNDNKKLAKFDIIRGE